MVVIDATMLLLFLRPDARPPKDASGQPIFKAKERVESLIAELERQGTTVIVPAPALSEALVRVAVPARQAIVDVLSRHAGIRIESFDQKAAIEMAVMLSDELQPGKKIKGEEVWAKVKFDRQIMAIARTCGASTIYSDDEHIRTLGARAKLQVLGVADLPLPESASQLDLEGIT